MDELQVEPVTASVQFNVTGLANPATGVTVATVELSIPAIVELLLGASARVKSTPVPLSAAVRPEETGDADAEPHVPVRLAVPVGRKVIVTRQLAPAGIEAPQLEVEA